MRTLSLKQLKEVIQDIYNQKQKYDKKCSENKSAIETMEQYMYSHLNQRYGLKNLIIEWAAAIINGIRRYSLEDADVALFGKIMRNECDEDFRFVYSEVKAAILDLIKDKLKLRYRNKPEAEILNMVTNIQAGYIEDWQWKDIINKMYNEEHAIILEQIILDKISDLNKEVTKYRRKRTSEQLNAQQRRRIPFKHFQKVIYKVIMVDNT